MSLLGQGHPGPRDIRLGPGLYWAEHAGGRLESEVAVALTFAYLRAMRNSGRAFFPPIIITQGGFNTPTPGLAHDGGGVVDLRSRHMSPHERDHLIRALTATGFAVYDLGPPDYAPHIHAIFSASEQLNSAAARQAAAAPHKPA